MPSELFQSRLRELLSTSEASRSPVAGVYREALAMAPSFFTNRSFGEAIAVATGAYQAKAARAQYEHDRLAWYKVVSEVQQLLTDLT